MKKRIICFVLTMAMVLSMLVVVPAVTVSADTWSTSGTTHTISTANDLMSFASAVTTSEHFSGHTVVLANDIDMSGKSWQGVGYAAGSSAWFSGTFNGQGHKITNIAASAGSNDYYGALFRELGDGAVVENVALYGAITVTRTSTGNSSYFGTVVAALRPGTITIQNVYSAVNLDGSHLEDFSATNCGWNAVGGLVGTFLYGQETFLTIDSCVYAGTISANCTGNGGNRPYAFGGLVGMLNSPGTNNHRLYIKDSAFLGTVNVKSMNHFGAFVGSVYDNGTTTGSNLVWIDNCYAAGTVSIQPSASPRAKYNGYLVGAFGYYLSGGNDSSLTMSNCTNRIYFQNCYYVSANYSRNGNTENTFDQLSGNQRITATQNRTSTDRANFTALSPSTTQAGNGGGPYFNVNDITVANLCNMTAGTTNFSNTSAWHFFADGETLPLPTYIYENFYVAPIPAESYIGTAEELAAFAASVNGGETYEGKTVYLTANIAAGASFVTIGSRSGGNSGNLFKGTFDGQGHTVTFSHTVSSDTTGALFGYLGAGAVVRNLKLDGTITTSGNRNFIAPLANAVVMAVSIQNVWSSVTITAGGNINYSGGLIGFMENGTFETELTIDRCVVDGAINCGNQAYAVAGFVGYTGNIGDENKALTITNSVWNGTIMLNDPSYSTSLGGFVGYQPGGNSNYTRITIANCISSGKFTFNTTNDWSGRDRRIAMVIAASCVGVSGGVANEDTKKNCPVILTNVFYRNAKDWAGNDIPRNNICNDPGNGKYTAPVYTNAVQKTMAQLVGLSTSSFADSSKWNGGTSTQIPCPASVVNTFSYPASMTKDAYDIFDTFEVGTADALIAIATAVNSGSRNYSGKTVLLTADINLAAAQWVSIGSRSADKSFCGTFDGQGYTISNLTATTDGDTNGALFGFVGAGAVIQNFTLTGTITATAHANFLATVINCVQGSVTLQNVRSTVKLTQSDSGLQLFYTGGLVGFMNNNAATNLTIDGCVYDGAINTAGQTHFIGGIIGYTGLNASGGAKTLTITNTAFNGQINLNDPGYFEGNSCFIGFANKGDAGLTVTVNDCVSTGKISYNKAKTWSSTNSYAYNGVLIGQVKDGTTLSVARFYYTPVTVGEGELTAIGLLGETYGASNAGAIKKTVDEMTALTGSAFSDSSKWKFTESQTFLYYFPCPVSFPAIAVSKMLEQARVTVEARDTDDDYEGIRFVGTFYNTAACHNAGTKGADFGLLVISADLYNSDLDSYDALIAAGAKNVKAAKYKTVDGAYVIHAVVYGIPDGCKDVSLVAIPYMSDYLGEVTAPVSYNTVFN